MAFLWFGKETKLEDFKTKDLTKEKLSQQVQYDQLLARQRRASEERDNILASASSPGVTQAEKELSAYKMSRATKRKNDAESEMQRIISRLDVLDSTIDLINRKSELRDKGIWGKLNELDPDKLQEQLEAIAIERKKGEINLEKIAEVLDVNEVDVKAKRSAGFRKELEAIESASSRY